MSQKKLVIDQEEAADIIITEDSEFYCFVIQGNDMIILERQRIPELIEALTTLKT